MKTIIIGLLLGLLSLSASTAFSEPINLRISVPEYYIGARPLEEVLTFVRASLSKSDLQVDFFPLPSERANRLANKGDIDGEIAPGDLESQGYLDLIQSSFPLILVKYILVYRQGESLTAKNISSLAGVIPLNMHGTEAFITKENLKTSGVKTSLAALEMVVKKRADYAIVSEIIFLPDGQNRFPSLEVSKDFYTTVPIYFRLNKKHKALMPIIESNFQKEKRQNSKKYPSMNKYFGF